MSSMGILDDNILHNILIRLPSKLLLRFRCVSRHWNSMITDPYCMKSRLRRMIILSPLQDNLALLDHLALIRSDQSTEVQLICSPLFRLDTRQDLTPLGTCNRIVLLARVDYSEISRMILFNPLTRLSKDLELPPCRYYRCDITYVYGFGHGAMLDDLKIVRIGFHDHKGRNTCDVFDLKKNSWSTPQVIIPNYNYFRYCVGKILNGFLYWFAFNNKYEILALNVKEMVFSKIDLPFHHHDWQRPVCGLLGTLNGCLCMMTKNDKDNWNNGYDLWVMKELQGIKKVSWLKACSFTLSNKYIHYPISILDQGKIMIREDRPFWQLYIYDTFKNSCQKLNSLVNDCNSRPFVPAIEYVESLFRLN